MKDIFSKSSVRKCNKCGRTMPCRLNKKARCKGGVQALCINCSAEVSKEWYMSNAEYKKEYSRQQYAGNFEWLQFVKKNLKKLTPEQKLHMLFTGDYKNQKRNPDCY